MFYFVECSRGGSCSLWQMWVFYEHQGQVESTHEKSTSKHDKNMSGKWFKYTGYPGRGTLKTGT